jgi:translation initiation factor 3 subunit D
LHETCLVKVQALNEIDARAAHSCGAPDWRQKIDSQRGAVMASELKNNSHKLSKWITEAIIADVDQLRLGFVSRASPKDRKNHVIIGQSILKPYDFANQMNLNIYNGWGIARAFIDLCLAQSGDGKFVLVKDPQRQILRLYQASASADLDIIEDEEVAEEDSFE